MAYSDNIISQIKIGSTTYDVKDAQAAGLLAGDKTVAGSVDNKIDLAVGNIGQQTVRAYVDGEIQKLAGEDWTANAGTVKAIIDELSESGNAELGTVADKVRGDFSYGPTGEQSTDIKSYIDNKMKASGNDVDGVITGVQTRISNETTARETAITGVQGQIGSETTARETAITGVQGQLEGAITGVQGEIGSETTARETAITGVQSQISGETTARETAITGVQGQIGSETTARETAITGVQGQLTGAITGVQGQLTSAIDALDGTQSQTAADGNGNIAAEIQQVDGVISSISVNATSLKSALIGTQDDTATANTIAGAKAYADNAIANQTKSSVTDGVLTLGL